jgi:hypothetical protein
MEQVVKDPREHFAKGHGFEDAPEDTVEEEKVKQGKASTNWEDVKEEETRGSDTIIVLEVKTEFPEGEVEAKFDDDNLVKDCTEHFVKGDRLEDDPKDTVEAGKEQMMKQDEAPNNWEDGKREKTLITDTINVPEARTEFQRTSNIHILPLCHCWWASQ